ncbi:MAG: glycosyltransferase [Kineosporiaceae bacterium]|nr:glycosyltransferase [Kineosporiaceae bacterium]
MRILMLVATSLASDTRVLREATTLARAGHCVHVIGKQVPTGWQPPDGVTASSVGASSVFRPDGAPSLSRRRLSPPARTARWLLLPTHRNQAFGRWATGAEADGAQREYDVVHAHDFTALEVGDRLARRAGVPLVYDSHELWSGRPRIGRPTPWQARRERAVEAELGSRAAAVITVGDGVAAALRQAYGWRHVHVVRNTFPLQAEPSEGGPGDGGQRVTRHRLDAPVGAVYAGRLAPYRELETIAEASRGTDLPITLVGPADETWLAAFDPGRARVEPARSVEAVDDLLAEAGLALVTHSDRWVNHRLAMPNKLFHAVHVGVPVVATDVGELGAIVRHHGVGELYRPGDAASLLAALQRAGERYGALCDAVRTAAPALSWEADAAALTALYAQLGDVPVAAPAAGSEPVPDAGERADAVTGVDYAGRWSRTASGGSPRTTREVGEHEHDDPC